MKKLKATARITEVDTVSDTLIRLYKAETGLASDAYLSQTFAEIENLSAKITTAIKRDKVVSDLDEADAKRDEVIRQLNAALTGYAAIPIAAKKNAAVTLLAVFDKYGKGITGATYAEESSLVESMLEDFAAAALGEAIKALDGLSDLIAALRTAQDGFNKANDTYNAALANKADSATGLKKPLLAVINDKLVPYLTAMNLANPAVFGNFVAKAENEIVRANAAVKKRVKNASAEDEPAENADS